MAVLVYSRTGVRRRTPFDVELQSVGVSDDPTQCHVLNCFHVGYRALVLITPLCIKRNGGEVRSWAHSLRSCASQSFERRSDCTFHWRQTCWQRNPVRLACSSSTHGSAP